MDSGLSHAVLRLPATDRMNDLYMVIRLQHALRQCAARNDFPVDLQCNSLSGQAKLLKQHIGGETVHHLGLFSVYRYFHVRRKRSGMARRIFYITLW